MNEILNQKYGVEVEMYNITRAKAAYVVCESLTRLTGEAWTISAPGCHAAGAAPAGVSSHPAGRS